jgi:hypothetical protein
MHTVKTYRQSFYVVAVCILLAVVSTLQAQDPTPTPEPTASPEATPIFAADDTANHQVPAGQGQVIVANATDNSGLVTSAEELDAIRLEIITQRRFIVIIGGIFFGWLMMVYLFRSVAP